MIKIKNNKTLTSVQMVFQQKLHAVVIQINSE